MAVTIKDISQYVGLSVSTVSKALNNYADISPKTRKSVLAAARELDYHPSSAARSLRRGRTDKIGLSINNSVAYISEYLAEVIPGAALTAEEHGKNLLLYTSTVRQPDALRRICRAREVDGVILLWSDLLEKTVSLLKREKMPFVVLGRRINEPSVSYVTPDNLSGAKELTNHLIELGHRRIGFTTRPELSETNNDRFAGYRQALSEAGIAFDENLVVTTFIQPRSGYHAMNKLLDLPEPPSALFAFHDLVAVDASQAAIERGLRIPEDVAIAGFDGLRSSLITRPSITTVRQPLSEMGLRAMEIVLARIEDNSPPPVRETYPVELVVRESTIGQTG